MCCFMQARAEVSVVFLGFFIEPSPGHLTRDQQDMCTETESFSAAPVF